MKCDIIIPVWNQLSFTKDCVDNIIKNTQYPYRLILIDNGSDEETKRYLEAVAKKESSQVILIRNEKNLGYVKAVNQGLRISSAPYICVFNNDTIPAPGWLEKMVEFAESHPDVGLINPQCSGHDSDLIEEHARRLDAHKGRYMEMNQCQGFCMLIKREVVDKVGYLDEAFGIGGYDDTDYSMRAYLAGYRSACVGDAYVYHRLHGSFDKSGDRETWVRRNRKIYYEKWGRHLRAGLALTLKSADSPMLERGILFAYGLAREWSWVHIWIDSKIDKKIIKKKLEEAISRNGLPPHQNIRINIFNLPQVLFDFVIAGKLFERMRRRMKDKKFDAVIAFERDIPKPISLFARAAGSRAFSIVSSGKDDDWQSRGRELALLIKKGVSSKG